MLEALIEFDPEASEEALKGIPRDEGGRPNIHFEWAPKSLKELKWPEKRLAAITRVMVTEVSGFDRDEIGQDAIGSTVVSVTSREVSVSCKVDTDMPCDLAYNLAMATLQDVLTRKVRLGNSYLSQAQPENGSRGDNRSGRTRRGSRGSRSSSPPRPHNRARGEE